MKKIIMMFAMVAILASCDNKSAEYDNELDEGVTARDGVMTTDGRWDHKKTYVLTGTAKERKTSFDDISSDLEMQITKLTKQEIDDDVKEKLREADEKIDEAREKLAKADQKAIDGNTEDAREKIEDAREKLEEAREKYMEALEKLRES